MFKKSALAVVVAASMIPAAAMADTTVYGQARVFAVNEDNGTDDAFLLESEASRIGIKGNAELDGDLEVIYKFEYEVDPADDSNGGIGKNRNNYVGLKGNFGQVIFGTHDTPLKKAQGKVDLFSDYYEADIKKALTSGLGEKKLIGENREKNIAYYKSPKIADAINIHVALMPGETAGDADKDGIADNTSIAVTYKVDNLFLSLANDQRSNDDSVTRIAAQFKSGAFGVGALYQMAEDDSADLDEDGFVLSGYFKASDNVKLKLQHVMSEVDKSGPETTQTTAGVDYKLGKKTTLAGYFTTREVEVAGATSDELDLFGLGLIHKF
jgi:predicted porin